MPSKTRSKERTKAVDAQNCMKTLTLKSSTPDEVHDTIHVLGIDHASGIQAETPQPSQRRKWVVYMLCSPCTFELRQRLGSAKGTVGSAMNSKELREANSCRAAVCSCAMGVASTQARPRAAAVWRSKSCCESKQAPTRRVQDTAN